MTRGWRGRACLHEVQQAAERLLELEHLAHRVVAPFDSTLAMPNCGRS
jgi:hypothetical protein